MKNWAWMLWGDFLGNGKKVCHFDTRLIRSYIADHFFPYRPFYYTIIFVVYKIFLIATENFYIYILGTGNVMAG